MSDNQITQLTKAIQAMDKKFDKRFQAVDDRFDAMDKKFDKKFQAVDDRFDAMDKKFDKKFQAMDKKFDSQFTKLFKYMNKEFDQIHKQLDATATKAELNTYANAVDAYMKRTETYHQEMLTLGHKVDRHEKWHEQTAKAVGIKLSA
jgi:predicted  nucleic acid-binding Zn-ribbon protein